LAYNGKAHPQENWVGTRIRRN